jgi:hypothetical protein
MSIIGIAGRMGSGKNTVGYIIEKLCLTNNGPKFEQKSFARKLKQIASLLTGIPVEDFEDQEFKKSYLGAEWGTVESNPLNSIPVFENIEFNHLMSVREFLQKLGTDAMRDNLHINVWCNALFSEYRGPKMSEYNPSNWIITDMRFPNEMEAVKERKGITIRVVRPVEKSKTTARLHPSETSLDKTKFDYEIINDAGIPELIEKVRQILITEKII